MGIKPNQIEGNVELNGENIVGSGSGVFKERVGSSLKFRRIVAGPGIDVTETTNSVVISNTQVPGEINTLSPSGTSADGVSIVNTKVGTDLRIKRVYAGSGITITENANNIVLSAAAGSGEANTASNVGTGSQIFKTKSGVDLQFRTLVAGTGVTLTQNANDITISATGGGGGEANTASNVGTGTGEIFKEKSGVDLRFRKLIAGTGITISTGTNDVTISATGGGGEANTGANVGTGAGQIFKEKSGVELRFRRLIAGTGITISTGTDDVTISATGGSGEANTASNLGTPGSGKAEVFASKVGVDLQFKRLVAGTNVTLSQTSSEITISATGGGGGHETKILSFDSGNIVIKASGTASDLLAVTATKDFSVSGVSTLILNKPTSVTYHSVYVTFTSSETTGRTEVRLEAPDMNGATSSDKAVRPFAIRFNNTYGIGATSSTFTLVSGSTFRTAITGFTGGAEQKASFLF